MNNCLACGKYIQEDDRGKRTEPHHVVSRGAGGSDDEINKLDLCVKCHRSFHHIGWITFIKKYPHLKERILVAREAGGKKTE